MITPQSPGLMKPRMNALRALAGAASLALFALPAQARPAAVSGIVNGSFEETTVPGVWVPAASWTEVSGTDAAYSLPTGTENIPATDGTRFLRLQTEGNGYIARVAQNLGVMVAGETYTFRADVIASTTYGPYGATAAFVNEGTVAPTTTYATQTVSVAQGDTGGFILSYTAQSADDGQELYIWLESVPQTQGYSRGGIDHARLDGQPEPPAVPSAPSPANGAGIVGVSPTLTWASDPLATSYQVFLWPVGASKPGTATATPTDPTYSPGTLLQGLIYQWQVVAVNDVGTTPGPVWTFTTGLIPFTYVYEADSVQPAEPELSTPSVLNDGVIGTGWGYLYYAAAPSSVQPHITLTLGSPVASQGKLTVWHYGGGAGGVNAPASLTVTDEFGHNATTIFPPQGSDGVYSQDVALNGMEGTVLHLNFASAMLGGSHIGLHEIRVFEAVAAAPQVPAGPRPSDGNIGVPITASLMWNPTVGATSYDVYFWNSLDSEPSTPTATDVPTNSWTPTAGLIGATEATYRWKVVAKNGDGTTAGPVWTFTTSIYPYTYVYESDSINPGETEWSTPQILNDGDIGRLLVYVDVAQASNKPHLTLTLASVFTLGKMSLWYQSYPSGISGPDSVTVSDDFGHSLTSTLPPPAYNGGSFIHDVPLTGLTGPVLHLVSTRVQPWVGLSEIKVFAPAPVPPETPTAPVPADGNISVPVTASLGWNASVAATSYDVYFWNSLDAEPLTATVNVTTNSWTPTAGLISASEATYHWKVVAKNDYGDAAGAMWTFTTSVITYTYVYEAASVPPNVPAELATPAILNDGIVGTTWDGKTQLYGSGTETLNKPSLMLTLSPYGSLDKLTVWYLSWTAAGVFVPDSLTVSDNFGHSATTPFAPPAGDNAVFSQDVPLTGMQGSVLHLSFTCTQYWVGLDEIKVFGTAGSGSGYDTWASVHADGQTAEKDFDHDGVPNGVEYFMDAPDGFTENPGVVAGKVTWSRVNPVASFGVQVSDNLTDWSPANPADVDLSDPSQVIYTFPSGAAKKFCRLVVTP